MRRAGIWHAWKPVCLNTRSDEAAGRTWRSRKLAAQLAVPFMAVQRIWRKQETCSLAGTLVSIFIDAGNRSVRKALFPPPHFLLGSPTSSRNELLSLQSAAVLLGLEATVSFPSRQGDPRLQKNVRVLLW